MYLTYSLAKCSDFVLREGLAFHEGLNLAVKVVDLGYFQISVCHYLIRC